MAKSAILVAIQLLCLAFFFLTGPLIAWPWYLFVLQLVAVVFGVWALLAMRFETFSILPEPRLSGEIITRGPYKLIRHPMYTSLIIMCLALLIAKFDWFRLGVLVLFCANQIVKLLHEEKMLKVRYDNYGSYMKQSWRLLPWVF